MAMVATSVRSCVQPPATAGMMLTSSSGGDGGGEVVEVADVLVVHVDIDEPAELARLEEAFAQRRIPRAELAQDLADGGARGLDAIVAAGVGTERRGDADDWHDRVPLVSWSTVAASRNLLRGRGGSA